MAQYHIKKATEKEKSDLLELGRKIVDVYERTHLGDDFANSYLSSGSCDSDLISIYDNASVILDGENLLGFIFIHENEIQGLAVDVPYWGTGVAQLLLAYAEKLISEHYEEIVLECFESSPRANGFYLKMGYINCDLIEGDGGRRIFYKKAISLC